MMWLSGRYAEYVRPWTVQKHSCHLRTWETKARECVLSLLHGENLLEDIKGRNGEEEEHSCVWLMPVILILGRLRRDDC